MEEQTAVLNEKASTRASSDTNNSSSHPPPNNSDNSDNDDRPASKRTKRLGVETTTTTTTTTTTSVAATVTESTSSSTHSSSNNTSTTGSVALLDPNHETAADHPPNHDKDDEFVRGSEKDDQDDDNDKNTSHETRPVEANAATASQANDEVGGEREKESQDDDEDNHEEEDDEDFPLDEDETVALQQILAAARARGIPLEFLAQLQDANNDEDDDTPTILPYDPPQSLQDVAKYIQSDACQNILILAGAGMSVASGIPDFRSANGLYATLDASKLSCTDDLEEHMIAVDPSYALDQELFLENPLPCLEVNRAFCLGMYQQRWKATLAHRLLECLCRHYPHKVTRLYTQNIDGLEDQCDASLPQRRIAVHGSMDQAKCAVCDTSMPMEEFCHRLQTQIKDWTGQDPTAPTTSTPIVCRHCHRPTVKPDIVLFRSSLPKVFFESVPHDTQKADLLLILGTSLGVAPANSLVWRVPKTCMRVLLNRDPVGQMVGLNFAEHARDYWAAGTCEVLALELLQALGWLEDLRPLLEPNAHDGTMKLPQASHDLLKQAFEKLESKKEATDHQSTNEVTSTGVVDGDSKPSAVSS